jgi:hypothetical protein
MFLTQDLGEFRLYMRKSSRSLCGEPEPKQSVLRYFYKVLPAFLVQCVSFMSNLSEYHSRKGIRTRLLGTCICEANFPFFFRGGKFTEAFSDVSFLEVKCESDYKECHRDIFSVLHFLREIAVLVVMLDNGTENLFSMFHFLWEIEFRLASR